MRDAARYHQEWAESGMVAHSSLSLEPVSLGVTFDPARHPSAFARRARPAGKAISEPPPPRNRMTEPPPEAIPANAASLAAVLRDGGYTVWMTYGLAGAERRMPARGTCATCGGEFSLTLAGLVRSHGKPPCEGTGEEPGAVISPITEIPPTKSLAVRAKYFGAALWVNDAYKEGGILRDGGIIPLSWQEMRKEAAVAAQEKRWRRVCAEPGCGAWQVRDARCGPHAQARDEARGTAAERGYDGEHAGIRAALLRDLAAVEARGSVMLCWRCEGPMSSREALDADHRLKTALEGGRADCLTHASCNRGKRTPGGYSGEVGGI